MQFALAVDITEILNRDALAPTGHPKVESLGKLSNLFRSLEPSLLTVTGPGQTVPELIPGLIGAVISASWEHEH